MSWAYFFGKEAAIKRRLGLQGESPLAAKRNMPLGKFPSAPATSAARGMAVWVWAAVCIAWIGGVISNFLVAPTNTGMNLADSYSAFQTGSNVGNVVALLLWSGASFWTGWYFSWSQGLVTARVLAAFGMTAVLSLYPASVVSAAVGHVVPIEDDFVYQDWLARPLLAVGVAALAAAAVILIVHARRR